MATANQISYWKMKEDKRHNLAVEAYNTTALAETTRHNLATEQHNVNVLAETTRSNKANEGIKYLNHQETVRSNRMNESIKMLTLQETVRSNKAKEKETTMHNRATEQLGLRQYKLDEKKLSHQMDVDWAKIEMEERRLMEEARHNYAGEMYEWTRAQAALEQARTAAKVGDSQAIKNYTDALVKMFGATSDVVQNIMKILMVA